MVEEDEGADHLALAVRQRAAHLESVAEIAGARHDDKFERVAGFDVAEYGIVVGKPAHGISVIFLLSVILRAHIAVRLPRNVSLEGRTSMMLPSFEARKSARTSG